MNRRPGWTRRLRQRCYQLRQRRRTDYMTALDALRGELGLAELTREVEVRELQAELDAARCRVASLQEHAERSNALHVTLRQRAAVGPGMTRITFGAHAELNDARTEVQLVVLDKEVHTEQGRAETERVLAEIGNRLSEELKTALTGLLIPALGDALRRELETLQRE